MVTAVLPSLWYSSRTSSASRSKKPECTKRWPGAKDLSWSVSARHRTFGCGRGAGLEGMQWPNHLHLVHADLGADRRPRRFRGGRDGHAEHEGVGSAQSAEHGVRQLDGPLHAGTQSQCVEADPVARPLACLDVHVETQVGQVREEARAAPRSSRSMPRIPRSCRCRHRSLGSCCRWDESSHAHSPPWRTPVCLLYGLPHRLIMAIHTKRMN